MRILEDILKGLIQWLYSLALELVQYTSNSLLGVFSMDLDYFTTTVPIVSVIRQIALGAGWALLLGNLVFQAVKSMAAGLGFEGEDPRTLFTRTFSFAFLLVVSPELCKVGLNLAQTVINTLGVPSAVTVTTPEEAGFQTGAAWLLAIIIGAVILWQMLKLFIEVGERYVIVAMLVFLCPLAFGLGGSENTAPIFKGWVRMFGSMCFLMVSSVIFLKLLLSALGYMPAGLDAVPWAILIVGIARTARKIDEIITRIGLNPAVTGGGLGHSAPGMLTYAVLRGALSTVGKSMAGSGASGSGTGGRSQSPTPGGARAGNGASGRGQGMGGGTSGRSPSSNGQSGGGSSGLGQDAAGRVGRDSSASRFGSGAPEAETQPQTGASGSTGHTAGAAASHKDTAGGDTQRGAQPDSSTQAGQPKSSTGRPGREKASGTTYPRAAPIHAEASQDSAAQTAGASRVPGDAPRDGADGGHASRASGAARGHFHSAPGDTGTVQDTAHGQTRRTSVPPGAARPGFRPAARAVNVECPERFDSDTMPSASHRGAAHTTGKPASVGSVSATRRTSAAQTPSSTVPASGDAANSKRGTPPPSQTPTVGDSKPATRRTDAAVPPPAAAAPRETATGGMGAARRSQGATPPSAGESGKTGRSPVPGTEPAPQSQAGTARIPTAVPVPGQASRQTGETTRVTEVTTRRESARQPAGAAESKPEPGSPPAKGQAGPQAAHTQKQGGAVLHGQDTTQQASRMTSVTQEARTTSREVRAKPPASAASQSGPTPQKARQSSAGQTPATLHSRPEEHPSGPTPAFAARTERTSTTPPSHTQHGKQAVQPPASQGTARLTGMEPGRNPTRPQRGGEHGKR